MEISVHDRTSGTKLSITENSAPVKHYMTAASQNDVNGQSCEENPFEDAPPVEEENPFYDDPPPSSGAANGPRPQPEPKPTLTKDLFATIAAAIKDKPADALRPWLLSDEVIGQAATLSKPQVEILAVQIVDRKVRGLSSDWINRSWRPAVNEKRKQLEQERRQQQQSDRYPTSENPYTEIGGRTFVQDKKGEWLPVCDLTAQITGQVISEHGDKIFVITGEGIRGGAFRVEIPALRFGDPGKLQTTLEAISPVDGIVTGMGTHMAQAIKKLSNLDDITTITRFDRVGWYKGRFLIPGREAEGEEIRPAGMPYSFASDADLDTGLKALESLIKSVGARYTTPLVTAIFQAPMAALAGWRDERYVTFVKGRTGNFKTSVTQSALCLYGPGFIEDANLLRWGKGATENSILQLATSAHDMPLLIDNYKPNTGGGEKLLVSLIHTILEGGEKRRLDRDSKLKAARDIYTWPIFTGEDTARDPATLARSLVISFPVPDGHGGAIPPDLITAKDLSPHLSAVGAAWIDWLESEDGQKAGEYAKKRAIELQPKAAEILLGINKGMVNVARVSMSLATNQATWETLGLHPVLGAIAKQFTDDYTKGLYEIAKTMANATAEALEAERFLAGLRELLSTGQAILVKDAGEHASIVVEHKEDKIIGWKDGTGGGLFYPETARRKVERILGDDLNGITNSTLYEQLDALGLISKGTDGKRTKLIKRNDSVDRYLHITQKAFVAEKSDK